MDAPKFDEWVRLFGRRYQRRRLMTVTVAGIAGGMGLRGSPSEAQSCATAGNECRTGSDCCPGLACQPQRNECIVRGNGTIGLGGLCIDDSDCRSGLACDPTGHCRLGPGQCSEEGGACQFHDACCGLMLCIGYEATGTGVCGGGICGLVDTGCGDFGSGVLPCCDGFVCTESICQVAPPETGGATLTIHVATCPTGVGPDIFNQCHGNVLANVAFAVADQNAVSGSDGVASASVDPGDVLLAEDSATFARFLGAYVYCSEQTSGAVLYDGSADTGAVELPAGNGDDIICDWYNITAASSPVGEVPTSVPAAEPTETTGGSATTLPSTGIASPNDPQGDGWIEVAALGAAAVALITAKHLPHRGISADE